MFRNASVYRDLHVSVWLFMLSSQKEFKIQKKRMLELFCLFNWSQWGPKQYWTKWLPLFRQKKKVSFFGWTIYLHVTTFFFTILLIKTVNRIRTQHKPGLIWAPRLNVSEQQLITSRLLLHKAFWDYKKTNSSSLFDSVRCKSTLRASNFLTVSSLSHFRQEKKWCSTGIVVHYACSRLLHHIHRDQFHRFKLSSPPANKHTLTLMQ